MRKKKRSDIIIHSAKIIIGCFVSFMFSRLLFVFKEEILSF